MNELAEETSVGVYQEGGKPANFHGTDICDGWAMLHEGMNYILLSREVLCELLEVAPRFVGLPGLELPHHNRSQHAHYSSYYDDETRDLVAQHWARDIETFGYRFEPDS